MPDKSKDQEGLTVVREFFSHALGHKATIAELPENKKFVAIIYAWQKSPTGEQEAIWECVGGPFVLDTLAQAESTAMEHLKLLSGELSDAKVAVELFQWLKQYSDDPQAEFLQPQNYTVRKMLSEEDFVEIIPSKIVFVHELYIVEFEGKWLLANLQEDGVLLCWSEFTSLEKALDTFIKST